MVGTCQTERNSSGTKYNWQNGILQVTDTTANQKSQNVILQVQDTTARQNVLLQVLDTIDKTEYSRY